MTAGAAIANAMWLARNARHEAAFARALARPAEVQERWLRRQLTRHADSEFGRAHDFAGMTDCADYARRVPLCEYSAVAPHVERIRSGERDVLSCGAVTHLVPTSGSTGARKLIPFTSSLQDGFGAAVGAWTIDLARRRPALIAGPAYWSVSPLADTEYPEDAPSPHPIPVGFADDADYLGGAAAWLVRQALAVPSEVRHVRDLPSFWALTLLALLRQRDLRLISVWHPSFLQLLVENAAPIWSQLLDAIAGGECPWEQALPAATRDAWRARPGRARATELRRIGVEDWTRWWPRLQVVSCWGEQAARAGWLHLRRALPEVLVQAKGLLATEGVVTIPYAGATVLAVTSHYFEFLDERGEVLHAHQLQRGSRYEVVVTNGGGLWRYRLGDVVECTGHIRATPALRFMGRLGAVSDLRGEKLSELFVGEVLRGLWGELEAPAYCALQPRDGASGAGYELLLSPDGFTLPAAELATRLEQALRANPHYALARRLGQLQPARVVEVGASQQVNDLQRHRGRLGDAKPRVLLTAADAPA